MNPAAVKTVATEATISPKGRAAVPVQAGRHPRLGLSVTRDVFLGGVAGQFRFGHAVHGRDARELGLRVGCRY